jgi:phosphoglycerate dehydrogenase-like enzyme
MSEVQRREPLVVFVGGEVNEEQMAQIRAAVPGADCRYFTKQSDLEERVEEAEVIAGRITPRGLARAKRLKWVQSWAAGPDEALFPEMIDSPVTLTCCKGNGAIPLAEHAVMLMLMLNREAMRWIRAQDEHRWERFVHGELNGLTCGIIGLGHSGQDLALKAKAFHLRVIGVRRSVQSTPNVEEMFPRERLHDFLGQSDFVVVTAPRTPETIGMLGEAEFRAMKPTAYYICFSRGGIADDGALLRALNEGWIAGAGLDAHGQEPLPADSPFWTARNTLITPHNGATTRMTRQRGVDIFVDNLKRYAAGQPLRNVVDKRAGY